MSDLEQLAETVKRSFPDAELELTPPTRSGQAGWLDISKEGMSIAIEWRPEAGFGISVLPNADAEASLGLFDGPDEVFGSLMDAERHLREMLGSAARPRFAVSAR
jgi:hypothetical protein